MEASIDELEERACRGDAAAFGLLIRQFDRDLRGTAWSVVGSAGATDDVMQASYEKAFRSIGSFRRTSSLKTWLHSICYRTAIDHLRRESRRHHPPIDDIAEPPARDAVDDVALDRLALIEALGQLDAEQRTVLMLTAGLGYSFDEAAQIMGLRRGTVGSKAARARRKLERWTTRSASQ